MAVDAARAKSLFFLCSDLNDPAERARLLERECGGDADLLARVQALLAAHDAAPMPSAGPDEATSAHGPHDQAKTEIDGDPTARVGSLLGGKYKLIQEIGEGGMGVVFMAQQKEPVKRTVAIKVVKAGMDSKAVLARFEAERQALAMMDHPNIARVLDAGTTDGGRPFFVMELVKGAPITQYCDELRLSPRKRLELFVPVCQAIQHAHQKGVIHRDVKPNNVLVAMYDDKPVPKVIDFGVAKAAGQTLTDMTLMTGFGVLVGTPEYMSPEQATLNNQDVDTRSDIYSLGVLLYELLTGSTPVDRKTLGKAALLEVLRVVREVEAAKPSARVSSIDTLPSVAANRGVEPAKLSNLMKGELDWVLLKALEKDRARRYETANSLAQDIQRYLADELVEARPPTMWYRSRKFAKRHRGVIATGAVLLATLLIFTGGLYWQMERAKTAERAAVDAQRAEAERAAGERDAKRQAQQEARKARRQAEIADAVRGFLERDLIAQANPLDGGRRDLAPDPELKLKTAIDRAIPHVASRFEGKPLIEASIRRAVGNAYAGRGLYPEALMQLEKTCELYRAELSRTDASDVELLVRRPYIDALFELINLFISQGRPQQGLAALNALEDQIRQSVDDANERESILETTATLRGIVEGKDSTAELRKIRENLGRLLSEPSPEPQGKSQAAADRAAGDVVQSTMRQMEDLTAAMKLIGQRDYPAAERALSRMIDPHRKSGRPEVLSIMPLLADVYRAQGKNAQAKACFAEARDGLKKSLGEDHPSFAVCLYGLGLTLLEEKDFARAEVELRAALGYYEKRTPDELIRFEAAASLAAALVGQKKIDDAEPLLLAAYDGFKRQEAKIPDLAKTRLPETADRLIELYTEKKKQESLKTWREERAKYMNRDPSPGK